MSVSRHIAILTHTIFRVSSWHFDVYPSRFPHFRLTTLQFVDMPIFAAGLQLRTASLRSGCTRALRPRRECLCVAGIPNAMHGRRIRGGFR